MSASRTKFYLDKQNAKWFSASAPASPTTPASTPSGSAWGCVFLTFGDFPGRDRVYFLIAWIAPNQAGRPLRGPEEAKFWQGVRSNPSRSTAQVRSTFRDIDRRLADIEMYYTSRNTRLADEIDSLR
jgi:phage shock protein C